MTVVEAIGIVMAALQFCKKLIPTIGGSLAFLLCAVFSLAVTAFKFLNEATPFTFAAITFFVQVFVGATGAYGLVKVAGGNGANSK